MNKATIQLGITARDKITGFQGIVTGRCEYISGCDQALVQPEVDEKGASRSGQWFDIQRLERVGGSVVTLDNTETPGADLPAPVR